MRAIATVAATLLVFPVAAPAWNATGHHVAAWIAYENLTPKVRAKVDALLKQHPDYATLLAKDAPADPAGRARSAFLNASTWPDDIRNDMRLYDDTRADAKPTPKLAGFPDMGRHTNWHYIDLPLSADGTMGKVEPDPTALSEMTRIVAMKGKIRPYDIPWLVHVASDVHNPLHCVARFSKQNPDGDQGGNRVFLTPNRNLHSLWDAAGGTDASDAAVSKYATEILAEFKAAHPGKVSLDLKSWIEEGKALAISDVYTFGPDSGTREAPLTMTAAYEENARKVARVQLAKAGLRLAAILNQQLK